MATSKKQAEPTTAPRRHQLEGVVVSKSGDKTVKVAAASTLRHPVYKKLMKRTKHYMVHDAKNEAEVGQTVIIRESRPRSARKRWALVEILTS